MKQIIDLGHQRTSRILSLVLLLLSGVVLALSLYLQPDAAGHGTHTQLGLSSCSVLSWTSVPCPMCGMTTSFSLMAHGQVLAATVNQPMGAALFLLTLVTFIVSAVESVRPRLRWKWVWTWVLRYEGRLVIGFFVALALAWVYKIWLMGL